MCEDNHLSAWVSVGQQGCWLPSTDTCLLSIWSQTCQQRASDSPQSLNVWFISSTLSHAHANTDPSGPVHGIYMHTKARAAPAVTWKCKASGNRDLGRDNADKYDKS